MFNYLKTLKKTASSFSASEYTVVVGNQAADMDSCCSALLTAFLETKLSRNSLPLIDIPRSDLRLRKDIEYVLESLQIDPDWLLFAEDLTLNDQTPLFLVDHNAPTVPGTVKSIIDHHEIEGHESSFAGVQPAKIVKSGSCMSAVVNYYVDNFRHETENLFSSEPYLAALALSPVVQDTSNFTKKVEDEDRLALKFLTTYISSGASLFSPFESFTRMKKEKDNLTGLTAQDLLKKDYKVWGQIGISSLPKLFEKLAKKGLQDFPGALQRYRESEKLEVMIALASGTSSRTDAYTRQLAYCGPPDFNIAERCPELELAFVSKLENVTFYDQKNTAASRKQVAPAVKKAYAEYINKL